jgi:hypothetical protein
MTELQREMGTTASLARYLSPITPSLLKNETGECEWLNFLLAQAMFHL